MSGTSLHFCPGTGGQTLSAESWWMGCPKVPSVSAQESSGAQAPEHRHSSAPAQGLGPPRDVPPPSLFCPGSSLHPERPPAWFLGRVAFPAWHQGAATYHVVTSWTECTSFRSPRQVAHVLRPLPEHALHLRATVGAAGWLAGSRESQSGALLGVGAHALTRPPSSRLPLPPSPRGPELCSPRPAPGLLGTPSPWHDRHSTQAKATPRPDWSFLSSLPG